MDINSNSIVHYGVLGMKWGIRRYQNYDGSYTKKGVERYKKHETDYESAKKVKETAKLLGDKDAIKKAKNGMKISKRGMDSAYKKLKTDKLADQGKRLYQQGKTITSNTKMHSTIATASSIIGGPVGANVVNGLLYAKTSSENKKLRAYYAH